MRFFNTAGPVNPEDHYCIPPLERIDIEEIEMLIRQKKYFLLHAPRQTGKTTILNALVTHLNEGGRYHCVYINVEPAQAAREDVGAAMQTILSRLAFRIRRILDDDFFEAHWEGVLVRVGPFAALTEMLALWSEHASKPVVLLIDEIDSLVGDSLIAVLRQLREGYNDRPDHFPLSVLLCGVRDIRDYRIHSDREKTVITGGSAFNIKAESLRVGDFDFDEMVELIGQHETETGQRFTTEAKAVVWEYSCGQPWLVNALCYEICFRMKENRDRKGEITDDKIYQAKENLILRRETHLDQLADKLKEERVRSVIEPLISGAFHAENIADDDIMYVEDLGLISRKKGLEIANPIYAEIIPRQLTYSLQRTLPQETKWYVDPNGRLNMKKLLKAFQEFFREHSEHWLERFQYKEAGPQLLLQAFLQRIVNGGGRVEREYGQGRRRVDLLVLWPISETDPKATSNPAADIQKIVIELKIQYRSLEKTITEGLEQTTAYMDVSGAEEGHLVIFNRTPDISWEDKIFYRKSNQKQPGVSIWGM